MNRKTFCTLGLILFSLALPSILPAQDLILDGGFESGGLVHRGSTQTGAAYGLWMGVISDSYGWTLVAINSNRALSACGKGFPRGDYSDRGKRIFQEISGKSILPGIYTLKFKSQCDRKLSNYGWMEVTVAQRTGGVSRIETHLEKPEDEILKGYKVVLEKPLLTGQPAELTGMDAWRDVEISFEVPEADQSLLVLFSGMVDSDSFRIDEVSLTRKGGSPVSPEKSMIDSGQIVNPFKKPAIASKTAAVPVAVKPAPAVVAVPASSTVTKPAPVAAPAPASVPVPVPVTVVAAPAPRPVIEPVRPPVSDLILNGDFSAASLALPTPTGDTTAELSGRWIRSVTSSWEISPYGGNLGSYARAAASKESGRLLYVASDVKRSQGSYQLRFDYILTNPSDVLGVKVFVSDSDITVGTDGGNFRMNGSQLSADMTLLPAGASWAAYALPVELGDGYNYIYVLFTGCGAGNTGIDNVSLAPRRR